MTKYYKNKAKECCDKLLEDTTDLTSRDMRQRSRPEQQAGPLNLGKSTWNLGIRPNGGKCINRNFCVSKVGSSRTQILGD